MDPLIWMICISEQRPEMLPNVVANWARVRTEPRARLLFVSNYPWPEQDSRVIHKRPAPKKSIGAQRNIAIQYLRLLSPDDMWATFDDDDYYSRAYATEALFSLSNAQISGKDNLLIHLPSWGICKIRWRYPAGSSLASYIRLTIFNDLHLGEDMDFLRRSIDQGMELSLRSANHYVYVRHNTNTWKIPELAVLADQPGPIPRWLSPSPALINGESPPPPDSFITLPHMDIK